MIGPVPGATSIVAIQDNYGGSGGLVNWGVNLAVDAIADALAVGYEPDVSIMRTLAHARVNKARDIGTAVHKHVEQILTGGHPDPTPDVLPYLMSYASFLAEHRPIYHKVEQRVFSRKHRYGGTIDALATIPEISRKPGILDVKSGKQKPSHVLQMAGYMASDGFGGEIDQYHRYFLEDDVELEPLPRLGPAYLLYLRPDGYELVTVDVTAADKRHFLYLAGTYHRLKTWQNGHERNEK